MLRWIALLCVLLPSLVLAQSFPTKPLRIVLPFAPGGFANGSVNPISPDRSSFSSHVTIRRLLCDFAHS